ncbi:MAG: hypothetical protein KAG56_09295 [Sulfurovaceae bacterium]|nr:hypothetical protein [Sulfurovaceae bacterium]
MNSNQWLIKTSVILIGVVSTVLGINYTIDPYGIYNTKVFQLPKITQSEKMRFIKPIMIENIKPKSIVLGTSRAEHGYDTNHPYFQKPSYNLGLTSASMYETTTNLKHAIKQGNLEQVLLILDYRMFNDKNQKQLQDFEYYFDGSRGKYSYLYSLDTFKDSLRTIFNTYQPFFLYHPNGRIVHEYEMTKIAKLKSQLIAMNGYEKNYYKLLKKEYIYKDTKKSSFEDFDKLLHLCHKHNIQLEIIFGPSHIRQWEALAYYLGDDTFANWKRDVVVRVDSIAKELNTSPYKIIDFSIYHPLTSEKMPSENNETMQHYYDASHYNQKLGNIVLDTLINQAIFKGFGIKISTNNIEQHLKQQQDIKEDFINVKCYRAEIFKE